MKAPKQIYVPYLGVVYEIATRLSFFVSGATCLFTTYVFYYNEKNEVVRAFCGSYLMFMALLALLCIVGAVFIWVFVVPSHNKVTQDQAVKDGRSLTYEKLLEIEKQLGEMRK